MTKITEKENIMTQEELEETVPVAPADPDPTPEPEEPTEPAELGITLPDDAPAAEQLTDTDRLLAFDADGNPLAATARQVKEFANVGMASLVPFSLEEQAVPSEFWDGKQVYVRSFKGSVHAAIGGNYIARNCFRSAVKIVDVSGSISGLLSGDQTTYYSFPVGVDLTVRSENTSMAYSTERNDMGTMTYTITVKYVYEA